MKKNDKEFHELQQQFEKDVLHVTYGHKIEKEDRGEKAYYKDGHINELFKMYMMGYENAKCLNRLGCLQ